MIVVVVVVTNPPSPLFTVDEGFWIYVYRGNGVKMYKGVNLLPHLNSSGYCCYI